MQPTDISDRPCEPACRRGRVEDEPVEISRLKRVGAGPSALAVARDLAPLGYHLVMYGSDIRAGGMMRVRNAVDCAATVRPRSRRSGARRYQRKTALTNPVRDGQLHRPYQLWLIEDEV